MLSTTMMSPRRLLAATALLSVLAMTATAQRLFADISGKWTMTVAGPQGANESAVMFKQDADTLTGNIDSPVLGASKLTGTVKGDTVRFAFTVAIQGMSYELKANGSVKDKDNIAGSLESPNSIANFPFTMKRAP